jgi:hypothetical protein
MNATASGISVPTGLVNNNEVFFDGNIEAASFDTSEIGVGTITAANFDISTGIVTVDGKPLDFEYFLTLPDINEKCVREVLNIINEQPGLIRALKDELDSHLIRQFLFEFIDTAGNMNVDYVSNKSAFQRYMSKKLIGVENFIADVGTIYTYNESIVNAALVRFYSTVEGLQLITNLKTALERVIVDYPAMEDAFTTIQKEILTATTSAIFVAKPYGDYELLTFNRSIGFTLRELYKLENLSQSKYLKIINTMTKREVTQQYGTLGITALTDIIGDGTVITAHELFDTYNEYYMVNIGLPMFFVMRSFTTIPEGFITQSEGMGLHGKFIASLSGYFSTAYELLDKSLRLTRSTLGIV